MQCFYCNQGALWTEKDKLKTLGENGAFFLQIKDKKDPNKTHYFYVCPACCYATKELLKVLLDEIKDEQS